MKILPVISSLWQKTRQAANRLLFGLHSRHRALLAALIVELAIIFWLSMLHFPAPPREERMEIDFQTEDFDFEQLKTPPPEKIPDISKYLNNNRLRTLASNEWQDENWETESRNTGADSQNPDEIADDESDDSDDQGPVKQPQLQPRLDNPVEQITNPGKLVKEKSFKGASRIKYFVRGRWKVSLRNPIYTCPDDMHGWISINIQVDRQGRVVHAQYDPKRSTSTKECLIDAALRYARRTRFNADPNGPPLSYGYIRYLF